MIDELLKQIPSSDLGQMRFINYYFYGANSSIESFTKQLKISIPDISFSKIENGIKVMDYCQLDTKKLKKKDNYYRVMSNDFSLEYDGFEIAINSLDVAPITEFSSKFAPNDFFFWENDEGNYIVGQYIAGKYNEDGCLFNIINNIFSKKPSKNDNLEQHGFLYKQPVFLKIEPNNVDFLSKSEKQNQSLEKYYFRCEIGTQSIDFINDNCSPDTLLSSLEDTINVLLDIYLKGLSVKIKDWIFFEYIVSNGKIIEIKVLSH